MGTSVGLSVCCFLGGQQKTSRPGGTGGCGEHRYVVLAYIRRRSPLLVVVITRIRLPRRSRGRRVTSDQLTGLGPLEHGLDGDSARAPHAQPQLAVAEAAVPVH